MCHTRIMRNALVALICALGFAQSPTPSNSSVQDSDAVIRTNVNVVIAPTTVRDRSGDFINGLQLQDFQLYDNNKLQRINADVRAEPLSLVMPVQPSSTLQDPLPTLLPIASMLTH